MKPRLCFFLHTLCLCLSVSTLQAWNFSPQESRTYVDGPAPRHYTMSSGDRKISLRVDRYTVVTGNAAKVEFSFPDIQASSVRISQSPLNEKKPDFLKELPVYYEAALKLVPAGSTDIVLVSQADNIYPINDWTSHEFIFKYAFYGRAMQSGYTFLNYNPKEQWIVEVNSSPTDFQATQARASRLLNTFDETDLNYKLEAAPN